MSVAVALTAEQLEAVDHAGRRTMLVGDVGTGKTTTLVARYCRLAEHVPPSRLLVVCSDGAAAQRFTDAVLARMHGGFDVLPITTVYGLAYGLVSRRGGDVRLLGGAEHRVRVGKLLEAERPADWPLLGHLLGRPAFLREVVAALPDVHAAGCEAAQAAGGEWAELAGFTRRYVDALEKAGEVDASLLLVRAAVRARHEAGMFEHILVDDGERLPPLGVRLVAELAGGDVGWTVACRAPVAELAAPVVIPLSHRFRAAPPGELIRCNHPSVEPEAIAGELLAAHTKGVPWSEMAVLVRHVGRSARAIARALARHGIPVVPLAALASEEPVVRAVLDLLRWVEGGGDGHVDALDRLLVSPLAGLDPGVVRAIRREAASTGQPIEADPRLGALVALRDHLRGRSAAGDSPAGLVYEAWAGAFADLAADGRRSALGAVDDRALDGLVALTDGLRHFAERNPRASLSETLAAIEEGGLVPDPWRVAASRGAEGVTITSIEASSGRDWDTVVVAGCVEGELPRPHRSVPLFDPARLGGEATPPEERSRQAQALSDERQLFAVATSRARSTLVATAAPQPGVL
ncbi:MAG: AAA family ATPase, partial [Actinomycetota bacterium]|nr:AAA family ATPase [Actinomycetota bacterium]